MSVRRRHLRCDSEASDCCQQQLNTASYRSPHPPLAIPKVPVGALDNARSVTRSRRRPSRHSAAPLRYHVIPFTDLAVGTYLGRFARVVVTHSVYARGRADEAGGARRW